MRSQQPERRLANIRFVTGHYEALQGLSMVPFLLVTAFFFFTATDAGERFDTVGWTVAVVVAGAVALAVAVAIGGWYRRTYGELRQRSESNMSIVWFSVAMIAALFLIKAADLQVSVSLEMIVVSVAAIVAGIRLRPLLPAFGLVGVVVFVLGVLPLGSWFDTGRHPLSSTEAILIVICLGLVVVAVWSHIVLVRTLGRGK